MLPFFEFVFLLPTRKYFAQFKRIRGVGYLTHPWFVPDRNDLSAIFFLQAIKVPG